MLSLFRGILGSLVLGIGLCESAVGQTPEETPDSSRTWHDGAWTQIVAQQGVHIDYIYYPEADNEHDGIVLRLTNDNDVAVRYDFTIIFRSPKADTSTQVQGRLAPGQMKTGDAVGLFWVPFKSRDLSLEEIGLRGLDIWPVSDSGATGKDGHDDTGGW